jgi:hypothetical protein
MQSAGLDLNDLGMLQSADDISAEAEIRRSVTTPTEHVLNWDVFTWAGAYFNFGGTVKPAVVHAGGDVTLGSFHSFSAFAKAQTPGTSDDLTRGGPLMKIGWGEQLLLQARTPSGRAHQLKGSLEFDASETLQQGVIASVGLTTRLAPSLRLDLTPSFSRVETHRQYVATVGTPAEYLFGHLHRTDAALELRATWSLSPDLVLTLYAQPFVSVGRYDQIGALVAPGSADVRWLATSHSGATRFVDGIGIAEPDYRVASLRSTAVLRWELRPGSILYVVWQQSRGGVPQLPTQTLHATVPELFTQPAIHTIAIKLSYWFG